MVNIGLLNSLGGRMVVVVWFFSYMKKFSVIVVLINSLIMVVEF